MKLYPSSILEKLGFEQLREVTLAEAQSARSQELLADMYPTSHTETVKKWLRETDEMMSVFRDPEPFPLGELEEIRPHLKQSKAAGSILPLYAFVDVLNLLSTTRFTKKYFDLRQDEKPTLSDIAANLIPLLDLEKAIKGKITESGDLRDDASPELKSIRKKLNAKKNELRTTINRIMRVANKDGMASEEGATIRNGRMVIPIQAEYKRQIQGFIHDVSSTGQTVYLEPVEALHLNNEIRQFEIEEQREIERILQELTAEIRMNAEYISQNIESLALLDVISAKAKVSIRLNADIPVISPTRRIKLSNAFNPNLRIKNLSLVKDQRIAIIPLNLEMKEDEHCLMITGPNAGGKSVAMKTAGICALMVQSGYAIPANPNSELPVFKGVFVDLGDDQSIENDLSTFSSRLKWMQETLDSIEEGSLVLIDEAGSGTDPEEGGALFQAFIEDILKKKCMVIVTTHHGSLKVFAHEHEYAVNAAMEFDQATLSPTYRFKKGVPGSSYAFEIAGRMNIKPEVLARSRQLMGSSKTKMESLILELESKTQQAENMRSQLEGLRTKAETEKNKYLNKLDGLEREKEKIRQKALVEAKSIMDNANKRIEQAVQQIVESKKADKKKIKEIRKDIEQQKDEISSDLESIKEKREERFKPSRNPPAVGDYVRFLDGNTTGELLEVQGKQAIVQADGLRLKTKFTNLVKVEVQKKKRKEKATSVRVDSDSSLNQSVPITLDLRGMRTQKAIEEVTQYLDRALFKGLKQVELVHGKGNGILKDQIQAYLKDRNDIKDYRTANEDAGGAGVTLVKL